ncbi:hypothetical protein MATL_G00043910 [Megalops atlanticus]|uniref:Ig-like domain-containing protein n=1 Tax=Megalops atlanticus TaxID=7932 RepID=A0A9D3QEX2_MEGAT|nr:hypothetical protein MATL_G00043910 [Megalops atlanticus]
MERRQLQIFALLAGLAGSGILRVSGITITTPREVEAVNGTDVKLKCSFTSGATIVPSTVTVSWNFRQQGKGGEETVFYFQDQAYPPPSGRFKGQVVWAGDIQRGDASIMLRDVQFSFNGTYTCQVKNPPDVHGPAGELVLKVVQSASISEIAILAAAVGGAIGLVLIVLVIVVLVKFCRRRQEEGDTELSQWEGKDPTVCYPDETLPLTSRLGDVKLDRSDETILKPCPKDPSSAEEEEEEESEDEKKSLIAIADVATDTVVATNTDVMPEKAIERPPIILEEKLEKVSIPTEKGDQH